MGPLLFTLFIKDFGANVVNRTIHFAELTLQKSDFLIIQQALIDLKLL